jgi:hypothetical protein
MIDEDETIAMSFLLIKEGVLSKDWTKVIEAYGLVTGEQLSLPIEQKSRLDNIRQLMKDKNSPPKKSWEDLTAKEIKQSLLDMEISQEELKNKSKKELVQLARTKAIVQNPEIVKESNGTMQVITGGFDPEEAKHNQSLAARKPKLPSTKRQTNVADSSKTEQDVRFYKEPPKAPPWR